jgi:hypothetical protein
VYQVRLKLLQAFQSYAGTYMHTHTHTHIHPFIYILYIYKIFIYIHIVICVPSLVEIAPGVPELCWNIHTHTHTHINFYIYIDIDNENKILPNLFGTKIAERIGQARISHKEKFPVSYASQSTVMIAKSITICWNGRVA